MKNVKNGSNGSRSRIDFLVGNIYLIEHSRLKYNLILKLDLFLESAHAFVSLLFSMNSNFGNWSWVQDYSSCCEGCASVKIRCEVARFKTKLLDILRLVVRFDNIVNDRSVQNTSGKRMIAKMLLFIIYTIYENIPMGCSA